MVARIPPDVLAQVRAGPVRGMIPAVENGEVRLIPWQEASRHGRGASNRWALEKPKPVPDWMVQQAMGTLPPVVHITHRERYRRLVRRLYEDGLSFYQAHGYIAWPRSVEDDIRRLGWNMGKLDLKEQVEKLAEHYIVKAARQQRRKDQKKVVLDHPGHYSA